MQLIKGKLTVAPGSCFICRFHGGESEDQQWIDTTISTEFEDNYGFEPGAVFVCSNCVTEMANLFGFMTQERARKILADSEAINDEVLALRKALEETRKANGALVAASLSLGLDINSIRRFNLVPVEAFTEPARDVREPISPSSADAKGLIEQGSQ